MDLNIWKSAFKNSICLMGNDKALWLSFYPCLYPHLFKVYWLFSFISLSFSLSLCLLATSQVWKCCRKRICQVEETTTICWQNLICQKVTTNRRVTSTTLWASHPYLIKLDSTWKLTFIYWLILSTRFELWLWRSFPVRHWPFRLSPVWPFQ